MLKCSFLKLIFIAGMSPGILKTAHVHVLKMYVCNYLSTWMHNEFRIAVLLIQAKGKQPSQDVYAVVNKDKGDSAKAKQTVRNYLCITLYVYGYSCYAELKFIACGNT